MESDRLVAMARECMDRKEYSRAKELLKQASAQAPLRGDLREMLVRAIELEGSEAPQREPAAASANRATAGLTGERRARGEGNRSLRLALATLAALVGLACLTLLGFYLIRFVPAPEPPAPAPPDTASAALPGEVETIDVSNKLPGNSPTADDPRAEERARLVEQARQTMRDGQLEEAAATMRAALDTNPPEPQPLRRELAGWYYGAGRDQYESNEHAAAARRFAQAAEILPDEAEYHFWQGRALFIKGRLEKGAQKRQSLQAARQALDRAIELDPRMLRGYETLAQTRIAQGDNVDGARLYRKIIDLDPASREARRARQALKSMGMTWN